jgi:hypothetical protein
MRKSKSLFKPLARLFESRSDDSVLVARFPLRCEAHSAISFQIRRGARGVFGEFNASENDTTFHLILVDEI